jgi:hypothetical protein
MNKYRERNDPVAVLEAQSLWLKETSKEFVVLLDVPLGT